jgi:hypothetical protein
MRTWLNANTPTGADGVHAWRIFDKDVALDAEAPVWKQLMAAAPPVPGVVVADKAGNVVYKGPLPASVQEAQGLLQKYLKPATGRKAG